MVRKTILKLRFAQILLTLPVMNNPESWPDGLPPFARSWRQLYGLVIASLVAVIGFLAWFTAYFQ